MDEERRMKNIESKQIKHFTDLNAWQEGHKLILEIYRITQLFPKNENFGLTSQMRRAAISITSNIAEGFSRDTYTDKARFYVMSHGSLTELQNHIIVSKDLGYINHKTYDSLQIQTTLVYRIISGLIRATKDKK